MVFATRFAIVRVAVRVAAFSAVVAVFERYSNHGALLALVALALSLAPPNLEGTSFEQIPHPALGLVRAQLVIVYVFSAINKLAHGFASGAALTNLSATLAIPLSRSSACTLSIIVIAVEALLPVILVWRPRLGIAGVVVLHTLFALVVPNVASFGLAMTSIALLFLSDPNGEGG